VSSANATRVLMVDDDPDTLEWMKALLESRGYATQTALNGAASEEIRDAWRPHLVLMDLNLPDIDGADLLRRFKDASNAEIVVISGHGSVSRAVDAMKAGAYSFIEKPVDTDVLLAVMEKALERSQLSDENHRLRERLRERVQFTDIIAGSSKMLRLFQLMGVAAPTEASILIHGESGTGKELVASAIHEHSKRANRPFIKINCAAVPSELMESELFGHKKGSFTGAVTDKVGLVELANGGSLLLDEIGEMAPQLQVKLLRLLQEREYRPIGSARVLHADFRLICATNAPLHPAPSKLREDLFFRINTITLEIPPLRERPEDVMLLCEHFLSKYAQLHGREIRALQPAAREALLGYAWPGNVRELQHVIERAVIVAEGKEIGVADLPDLGQRSTVAVPAAKPAAAEARPAPGEDQLTLAEMERQAILQALARTKGNKRAAADILGVYRPTLYGKLRKYKLGEYDVAAVAATGTDPAPRRARKAQGDTDPLPPGSGTVPRS
jgi:DNA-binding NtrC family response regulator